MNYHRTGASYPRHLQPIDGPLTIEERAELIDKLSAGSTPRAALVRKLLRLHDETMDRVLELEQCLAETKTCARIELERSADREGFLARQVAALIGPGHAAPQQPRLGCPCGARGCGGGHWAP